MRKTRAYDRFANVDQSIFSTRDEEFNRMRRKQVGPAFNHVGLNSVEILITEICVYSFKKKLDELLSKSNGVAQFNYYKYFQNVTSDVIGELVFGKRFDSVQNDGHPIIDWVNSAMINFVLVRVDTTSIAMTWLLIFYMLYPQIYKNVVSEIRNNFPDKDYIITHQDAKNKLPYFIATVYESLRIRGSIGSALLRESPIGGVQLCGYFVPEGTDLGMSIAGSHNDTRIWETPESFNPNRFLGPDGEKLKKEVVAFSSGVRVCIGKNLAWMQISLIITNMLNNYELELPNDSNYGPNILDPNRNNEPLIPRDASFATRPPANPEIDCNIIFRKRV
ncbi:Steroid 17-alpha-hydroxylase/17,20 lyase [Smittium culicis]|uniref:Steroid 17-alpha-hydroxylase/17,20 lyase n=1 Tax=Smittium culicis TaxID=133412 RepID=A0A1R1XYJ1_9FUNG|nr:Steroid 17-alpha-hydroxylase/17,20 lyase [Smittium culicis]